MAAELMADQDNCCDTLSSSILNSTKEAIIAVDNKFSIILINPAAQALTGLSANQSFNIDIRDLFKYQDKILYLINTTITEGRSIADRETVKLHRPNAQSVPIQAETSPLYTDNGTQNGAILSLRDASNLHRLEQDVRRVERLEMLDTLSSGLAHEIKNPLGGIRGAAQLLSLELKERPDLREYTQVMIKETDRINGIIEELMDLSNPRPQELSAVDLTQTINDIVLLQEQSKNSHKTTFNMQLDPTIPPIIGDQTLLTRLFLNLIKNGCEALDKNGAITITSRIDNEHHLSSGDTAPIPFVVIKVIDNGVGITAQQLQKMFTPFYTTKSKGSGLGMAICQKIINTHNGVLRIDSTPKQGTCCKVYLPLRQPCNQQTKNCRNGDIDDH